jgi:hypothetical protein
MLFLVAVSISLNIYRAAEISGFTKGVPLALPKRHGYMVYQTFEVLTMLAAFVLPSLRVLVRSKLPERMKQSERAVGRFGDPELGSVMFSIDYYEGRGRPRTSDDVECMG